MRNGGWLVEWRRRPWWGVALVLAVLVAACSSAPSNMARFASVVEAGNHAGITPIIANSELVVGRNRFAVGVIGQDGKPVVDAKVRFAFYNLNGSKEKMTQEMDAVSRVPARDAALPVIETVRLPDGSTRNVFNAGEEVGIYTAIVDFTEAGNWGLEMTIKSAKPQFDATLRPRFNVLPVGTTPSIGSPAPRSHNLTADDVTDISLVDSSSRPSRDMHTSTIAAAIAAGRPALVLFAVPGFCESRLCGPELEIMRSLYGSYKAQAEFIHVEFYSNPASPARIPVPAVAEWGIRTEPWFFAIDRQGNVVAKFEGPTSLQELDEALQLALR
jgi:hypothetical protein